MVLAIVLLVVLVGAVGALRFAWLAYSGLKNGRVKPAEFWKPYLDRARSPRMYWITLAWHVFTIFFCLVLVGSGVQALIVISH